MNIADYTDEELLAARETAAEPGIEEFTQEVIRLRGELREVLSLANMDCDGLNCPPSRALAAQVSALRSALEQIKESFDGSNKAVSKGSKPYDPLFMWTLCAGALDVLADTAAATEAHDAEVRAKALEEAINATCSLCREGVPFRAGHAPDRLPHQHFKQTTVDDDGSARGLANDCHAYTLRALAKGETK